MGQAEVGRENSVNLYSEIAKNPIAGHKQNNSRKW